MMSLSKIWHKISKNGWHVDLTPNEIKALVYTNTLLTLATLFYCVFACTIFFLHVFSVFIFTMSTALLLLSMFIVFLFIRKRKYLIAKNIMLSTIYFGIFFYDISLGHWAGVYLYYFAFFFACINIFFWNRERIWLIIQLALPLILVLITAFLGLSNKVIIIERTFANTFIFVFNFYASFLIIAINTFTIVRENIIWQKSLRQSKLSIQALIDNTRGYIWSIDNSYKILAFNSSTSDYMRDYNNIIFREGLNTKPIVNSAFCPKEIKEIYEKVLSGQHANADYSFNDNHFEIQASPLYDVCKIQIGATFHSRIVTKRKQSEQQLVQAKINIETLIDSIGNSTWSVTKDYKIIAASSFYKADMKRIFNVDITVGYDISTLFDCDNYPLEWQKQYKRVFAGESFSEDYMYKKAYLELSAVPIKNINGEVVGAVFFTRNITARKNIEQELIAAKINAEEATIAKAQFLSNMSHELRTPLNGIIGLTNILMSETYLPSQTNHLEVLKDSSDHMLILINDILDFNKIEAGKVVLEKNRFNLAETIEKMHSFFCWEASSKGLTYNIQANDELNKIVIGDVTRLRQVLTNLISNAIKFTEKGAVTFTAKIIEKISENFCKIRFSITDTGIGINVNKLDQIFESFGQADPSTIRKYGGSGLGLTISKKLIYLMGAELMVESKIKEGSNFWFDIIFECDNEEHLPTLRKTINEIRAFENISILVVEDNAVNMLVVTKMLEKWNVKVTKAKNGLEAIDLAYNNKYSLILMDLQMPIMDGTTATMRIRELNNNIPIIALTATTDENLTSTLYQKGFTDLVQKPFVPEDLHNKINNALGNLVIG